MKNFLIALAIVAVIVIAFNIAGTKDTVEKELDVVVEQTEEKLEEKKNEFLDNMKEKANNKISEIIESLRGKVKKGTDAVIDEQFDDLEESLTIE